MLIEFIIFAVSMGFLIYGADFIIEEAEKIAFHFQISAFVIGATVVALGTSLPEMAVSVSASLSNKSDLAVANVMGSVILNITLVLGLVFLISKKINPKRDLFAKDSSWALFPIFIFIIMSFDEKISRFEGFLFLLLMGGYLLFLSTDAKELTPNIDIEEEREKFNWLKTGGLLLLGFVLVIGGAHFAVESAGNIARGLGVSEWIIGLLLVAFGTSLPELVVSISATKKGNGDMVIGNIIGSNVANFTVVLGASAVANPLSVSLSINSFDILSALIASVMLVFITANKLYDKSAGIALLIVMSLVITHSIG